MDRANHLAFHRRRAAWSRLRCPKSR